MTVLVKIQIRIRFFIELHGNSKLSMTSCPPSSVLKFDVYATVYAGTVKRHMHANATFPLTLVSNKVNTRTIFFSTLIRMR